MSKISLKPYNTFGIEAYAKELIRLDSIHEAIHLFESKKIDLEQLLILGGGSNVLFTKDFEGTILLNCIKGIELIDEDESNVYLKVGAGENWHQFVLYCIQNEYAGLENLSLIPGCVGASPMQNIGAYGVEVKDLITKVDAIDLTNGQIVQFTNEECRFGYRTSIFKTSHKNQFLISHVSFQLKKRPEFKISYGAIQQQLKDSGIEPHQISIKAISDAVITIRESKLPDPKKTGNAGSFFKNPVVSKSVFEPIQNKHPDIPNYLDKGGIKIAAGWLIEKAGWKGFRDGEFGVHEKQALVLVNHGSAKGKDIFKLSEKIIEDVKKKFGIELEREVNII